ncbi:hypothetical protein EDF84_11386 [Erwinia rhapontici]|nr:hypothetical protein EDF84_11386 [Erwinia rhapontici]
MVNTSFVTGRDYRNKVIKNYFLYQKLLRKNCELICQKMVKALVKRIFRISRVYALRISLAPQSQRQATALQKEMADTINQMLKRKA